MRLPLPMSYTARKWTLWSLSPILQTDVIKSFNMTSRYLVDILIFVNNIKTIYPSQLILNTANHFHVKAAFLDLDIYISNGVASTKIYDTRDNFNFAIVNYPILMVIAHVLLMVFIFHNLPDLLVSVLMSKILMNVTCLLQISYFN